MSYTHIVSLIVGIPIALACLWALAVALDERRELRAAEREARRR